jgi:dolichol-phosphate mannosyltransferase
VTAHPRLGIVTPLANEERTVASFLEHVVAQLTPADRVFCVVDNVSRDRTRQAVEGYGQHDPRVACVWAPENRSVVDAYFRGYRTALDAGCEWILEMDAGGSHRPDQIPQFIRAMQDGYDFAAGSRFLLGGSHRGGWSRWFISKGGTLLANAVLGTRMRDMTSGFECFARPALQAIIDHGVSSRAHFFQTEIRYLLHDWRWIELPIDYTAASPSVGTATLKDALRSLWKLRRLPRLPRPDRP